jgi:hypothetical protein
MPNFNDFVDPGLIPDKTIALARMNVKAGGAGEDSALSISSKGDSRHLACSFTVIAGDYAKRKIFDQFTVEGSPDKHGPIISRSFKTLKQILNSANNLEPSDTSKEAQAKRDVGYLAFDGLVFWARIGIKPEDGPYEARNLIAGAVMRGQPDWPGPIDPSSQPSNGDGSQPPVQPSAPPASFQRPSWAR